jgi:hypothetical protein
MPICIFQNKESMLKRYAKRLLHSSSFVFRSLQELKRILTEFIFVLLLIKCHDDNDDTAAIHQHNRIIFNLYSAKVGKFRSWYTV